MRTYICDRFVRLASVLTLILLLLCGQRAMAQDQDETIELPSFALSVSGGFTTFELSDVKEFYHSILDVYHANNVPIPTQREFPGNLLIGLSGTYRIPGVVDVGLGGRYSWTRAFSAYEDYSGTLDVNAKVRLLSIEAIVQRDFVTGSVVDMYAGVRTGLVFAWSTFSQKIVFNDFPEQNTNILLSGNGSGFSGEGFIGAKRQVGNIVLGMCAGYRYANISGMNAEISLNGQHQESGTLDVGHNLSGFTVDVHVDIILR